MKRIWNTSPIISYEATRKTNQAVDGVNCLFQTVVKNRIDPYGCKILLLDENIKQCSGKTTEANFNVNLIDLGSDPESVSNEVDDESLANNIFQALAWIFRLRHWSCKLGCIWRLKPKW